MRWLLFALLFFVRLAVAGLEEYPELVRADARPTTGGIRVTYLGTNGYQFECAGHALLVDPYFSRVSIGTYLLDRRIEPDAARVAAGMRHLSPRVDAVLVTHAHVDHLLDVPPIMRLTGARLIAGPTAVGQARSLGLPAEQCRAVRSGDVQRVGPWKIRVLAAMHDRLFGAVPIGCPRPHGEGPPKDANDWVVGEPLAFIIEAAGKRIYIDSGGQPEAPPPEVKVDLAILGVALPDAREHFALALPRLRPRFILPSHQDNFFQPVERGFSFGMFTDFPAVLRLWRHAEPHGELLLLDYFRPWTLR